MKKTLITIGVTTVVVLTLVALASSLFGRRVNNTFSAISSELPADYGMGGGVAPAAEAPAPAFDAIGAPAVGGGDGSVINKSLDQTSSSIAGTGERLVIKNADLAIVVTDPKASIAEISKLA